MFDAFFRTAKNNSSIENIFQASVAETEVEKHAHKSSRYFRISLTDSCNLSCYFCHNEGQEKGKANHTALSAEDICWIASKAKQAGYTKFKLTGGEPTKHPQIIEIVRGLSQLGVEDLSMITNGFRLKDLAFELKEAGLHRLNVSLYTLDPVKFRKKNGGTEKTLANVIEGIDKAIEAGFKSIKLNYVWDGFDNLEDFIAVCDFAAKRNLTVVLLPILRFNDTVNAEEITLKELYRLMQLLGIKKEEEVTDNEGIRKRLIHLYNGSKILLRAEELKDKYPYEKCRTCFQKNECREGIFPTRLSADGALYPCLADTGNKIQLLQDIKSRNGSAVEEAFQIIKNF